MRRRGALTGDSDFDYLDFARYFSLGCTVLVNRLYDGMQNSGR